MKSQEPRYRIYKTCAIAREHAYELSERTKAKFVVTCIRPGAFMVAHKSFDPIKLGFGYPTFNPA